MFGEIAAASRPPFIRHRGRRWLAVYLAAVALCLVTLAAATPLLDAPLFAFVVVGIPALISAYGCAALAFAEAVARVELRSDGFTLRLPSYRGYFPSWPIQRLEASWAEVTCLSRLTVRARLITLPYDYVLHRIATERGQAILFAALPGISRNTTGASANLPVGTIMQRITAQTGLMEQDCGSIWGGGIWHNLLALSCNASFANSSLPNPACGPIAGRASDRS